MEENPTPSQQELERDLREMDTLWDRVGNIITDYRDATKAQPDEENYGPLREALATVREAERRLLARGPAAARALLGHYLGQGEYELALDLAAGMSVEERKGVLTELLMLTDCPDIMLREVCGLILAMPREWVLEHIEEAARPVFASTADVHYEARQLFAALDGDLARRQALRDRSDPVMLVHVNARRHLEQVDAGVPGDIQLEGRPWPVAWVNLPPLRLGSVDYTDDAGPWYDEGYWKLLESIRYLPARKTLVHCGKPFEIPVFQRFATCVVCGQRLEANHDPYGHIETLLDEVLEWIVHDEETETAVKARLETLRRWKQEGEELLNPEDSPTPEAE